MDSVKKIMQNKGTGQRKKPPVFQGLETGKLPPQAIDLEEAVLGAMMLEKEALNDVIDILKPESFYKEAHQKIFEAVATESISKTDFRVKDIQAVAESTKAL